MDKIVQKLDTCKQYVQFFQISEHIRKTCSARTIICRGIHDDFTELKWPEKVMLRKLSLSSDDFLSIDDDPGFIIQLIDLIDFAIIIGNKKITMGTGK
ncbi:MAG TPA: hypothetical protein VFZ52_17670, partial [Chryseolinea sp.]